MSSPHSRTPAGLHNSWNARRTPGGSRALNEWGREMKVARPDLPLVSGKSVIVTIPYLYESLKQRTCDVGVDAKTVTQLRNFAYAMMHRNPIPPMTRSAVDSVFTKMVAAAKNVKYTGNAFTIARRKCGFPVLKNGLKYRLMTNEEMKEAGYVSAGADKGVFMITRKRKAEAAAAVFAGRHNSMQPPRHNSTLARNEFIKSKEETDRFLRNLRANPASFSYGAANNYSTRADQAFREHLDSLPSSYWNRIPGDVNEATNHLMNGK